jgi:hypothetical protein
VGIICSCRRVEARPYFVDLVIWVGRDQCLHMSPRTEESRQNDSAAATSD